MANINRVNELPSSGLTRGDQFLLNVGGGKYQTHVVSDSLQLVKEAGADFIEKDTIAEMRDLSSREIWALQNGYYKGVTLNGYHEDEPKFDKPINYYLSETTAEDDGGSVIEVGDIKLEHKFEGELRAEYFGFGYSSNSPTDNKNTLQQAFNASLKYNVKTTIIPKGVHEIVGGGVEYKIPDSELWFEGELKLADGSASGEVQFIKYQADNITVYNQRFDGNRDNNTMNTVAGTQCNFSLYGINNPKFIGGYSKNSLQSHCHSTAENLIMEDYDLLRAGEHGLYLTLAVGQPKQRVTLRNVRIIGFGLGHSGTSVSIRSIRNGIYENCIFDATEELKPENIPLLQMIVDYRDAPLSEGETFMHSFYNCKFLSGDKVTTGIRCHANSGVAADTEANIIKGRGVYLYGGIVEYPTFEGVVYAESVVIKPKTPMGVSRLSKVFKNCIFDNILHFRPVFPTSSILDSCEFNNTNEVVVSGILFDFNHSSVVDGTICNIKNCTFRDFTTSTTNGIIRNANINNNKIILEGSKLINCTNAVLIFSGSSPNNVIINNSDLTQSGVRLRFDSSVTPKLVANNDFVKLRGTTAERPSGTTVYVGMLYDNTTTGVLEEYNGTAWVSKTPNATTTVKGVVNQSSKVDDVSSPNATDLATAITLINELKTKLNSKLSVDRASGQQSTT